MKRGKYLKILIIFLVIVLIVEFGLYFSSIFFQKKDSLYFDGINAIAKNEDYYVVVGSNNDNTLHYERAKLSIYNQEKVKLYEKLYNVGFNSAFFEVALDNNGFIAVGSYEKTEEEHKDSVRRALFVKYDFDGNVIFERDFQLLDNTKFTGVKVTEDGYYVVGQSIYKSSRVGTDSGGAILLKYDKKGDLSWYQTLGDAKTGIFYDFIISDDYIYTVGLLNETVGIFCKYQIDGTLLYQKDIWGCDSNGFGGIVQVGDSFYIGGSKKNDQENGAFIMKISSEGLIEETHLYDKVKEARFHKIIFDGEDSIVAIGTIMNEKKSSDKTAEFINYDGLIVKYRLNLEVVSDVTYGDDRDDFFTDILYDNGNYLVVGYSSYEDGSYLSKFIRYSEALKVLGVEK